MGKIYPKKLFSSTQETQIRLSNAEQKSVITMMRVNRPRRRVTEDWRASR